MFKNKDFTKTIIELVEKLGDFLGPIEKIARRLNAFKLEGEYTSSFQQFYHETKRYLKSYEGFRESVFEWIGDGSEIHAKEIYALEGKLGVLDKSIRLFKDGVEDAPVTEGRPPRENGGDKNETLEVVKEITALLGKLDLSGDMEALLRHTITGAIYLAEKNEEGGGEDEWIAFELEK